MAEQKEKALVPVVAGRVVGGQVHVSTKGVGGRALSLVSESRAVRTAAIVGAAFGAVVQLRRMWRTGKLRGAITTVRDTYKGLSGTDPRLEGRLAGTWVRYSVSMISTLSGDVDKDDKRDRN